MELSALIEVVRVRIKAEKDNHTAKGIWEDVYKYLLELKKMKGE